MLLGFRNGQIELARKGVDLVAEPSVVLESCVQPPLQQVISIVRGGQLRGDVVLGADLGVEFVFQVGVPVGQDVPFHVGFLGEPDDGEGPGGAQRVRDQLGGYLWIPQVQAVSGLWSPPTAHRAAQRPPAQSLVS